MHNPSALVLIAALLAAGVAQAQGKASGKIICWKDKSGKVIGCGDKVPPEYQDSATKELNPRGVTIRQSDAALTAEQRRAQQAEAERKQAEALKRDEQRRQDTVILDTYTTEKDIDFRRRRDVQQAESNLETLQNNLKNAGDRRAEAQARIEQHRKNKQPVPSAVQEDFDRAERDMTRIEGQIAQRRKEIVALNQKYDEIKKRFAELTSAGAGASAKPASQSPPAAGAAAAKK